MEIFIGLFVGLALGVIGTALVMRSRGQSDQAVLQERLSARESHGKEQQQTIESQVTELATARERITALTANEGVLKTRLADEQKQAAEKLAAIDDAQKKLSDAFKALADAAKVAKEARELTTYKTTRDIIEERVFT